MDGGAGGGPAVIRGGAAGSSSAPAAGPTDPDEVSIVVGGVRVSGWTSVRVTRGVERMPSDFDIALTERYPTNAAELVVTPGSPCQVKIGNDLVLTGYVDRYTSAINAGMHNVRISGRSKCEDLVDCSAIFQTYQFNGCTIVSLATQLAAPFGVTVTAADGDSGVIPQFAIVLTETPYEILERVSRYAQKLVYDGTDGNLIIAGVGTSTMASGFAQGVNVEEASSSFSMDQRYTEIDPLYVATSVLTNTPEAGQASIPYIPNAAAVDKTWPARADGQPRYRPLLVVSEQAANILSYAQQRAAWEMARRIGRSQAVKITCDSWRDQAGTLWQPNAYAPLNLPAIKVTPTDPWVIGDVSLVRDGSGQHAEITMMPKSAFVPEPIVLQPASFQIGQDYAAGQGGAAANTPSFGAS